MEPFALIAHPENRRVSFFREACRSQGWPDPVVLPWHEVLREDYPLEERLEGAGAVRIESCGEDFGVERQLIGLGSDAARAEAVWPGISREAAAVLAEDHGRVRLQRQWYHGWCAALAKIAGALERCSLPVMNAPAEIARAFDKAATQRHLAAAHVAVAPNLGICRDFDEVKQMMRRAGWRRVFVKPCHSSSASGVVALATDGADRWQASTSARLSQGEDGVQLHNCLKVQRIHDPDSIRRLVDAICRERPLVERWIPKASIGGVAFDLRILVVAGRAGPVVVRTSESPITNLHLGNRRGDPEAVRLKLGPVKWEGILATAEAAAACFPGCHYVGVDLMIDSALRRFVVAEVNAMGDLLPGVLWRGMNAWETELAAWPHRG